MAEVPDDEGAVSESEVFVEDAPTKHQLDPKQRKKNKKILRKNKEVELTYDMMFGMRYVLSKSVIRDTTGHTPKRLPPEAFSFKALYRFPSKGSNTTPGHQMRSFKFKDYAPKAFYYLRRKFGIEQEDYLLRIAGNFQLLEFVTNSKSGEFFFFNYDKAYIIKTMTYDESILLREILPAYYEHVMNNPDTLLSKFLGMHRVKPHRKNERYFLIMSNIFDTDKKINRTYDLKGAQRGRRARTKEKDQEVSCLKDMDFLEDDIKINVGGPKAEMLVNQIKKDTAFLRKFGIMDYSLLLGVHNKEGYSASVGSPRVSDSGTPLPQISERRPTFTKMVVEDEGAQSPSATSPEPPSENAEPASENAAESIPSSDNAAESIPASDNAAEPTSVSDSADSTPDAATDPSSADPGGSSAPSSTTPSSKNEKKSVNFSDIEVTVEDELIRANSGPVSAPTPAKRGSDMSDATQTKTFKTSMSVGSGLGQESPSHNKFLGAKDAKATRSKSGIPEARRQASYGFGMKKHKKLTNAGDLKLDLPRLVKQSEAADLESRPTRARPISVWQDPTDGGIHSTRSAGKIYFLGIIDILQKYNKTKKAEHVWKSKILRDKQVEYQGKTFQSLSSVNPDQYADRLIAFIEDKFV